MHAEKRYGRFGPEYFVSVENLVASGLAPAQSSARGPLAPRSRPIERTVAPPPTRIAVDVVPTMLYQELQLKHEQLLVQYGMVRAGGLRAIELRAETDEQRQRLQTLEKKLAEIRDRSQEKQRRLQSELHQARLELEGRGVEVAALQEKVRTLEMLTRNAVTNESIEQKYRDVVEQSQRVRRMTAARHWPAAPPATKPAIAEESDH